MASCCLCQCDLSSAQVKKRRKKLHGSSCNESRLEIEKKFGLGLDAIVETDQDSFLCKLCDSKLLKISELRQKLVELESDLKKGIILKLYLVKRDRLPFAMNLPLFVPNKVAWNHPLL